MPSKEPRNSGVPSQSMGGVTHPKAAGRARHHDPRARRAGGYSGAVIARTLGVYGYGGRAIRLVWDTSRRLTVALSLLSLGAGLLPAAVAYIGKLIVDAVVHAIQQPESATPNVALGWVAVELGLVALLSAFQRALDAVKSLLRAQLSNRVNVMIIEKALTLRLEHFEDSELYDKMTRARQEASSRPLSLVLRTFGLMQNGVSLLTYGAAALDLLGLGGARPGRRRAARALRRGALLG